MLQEDEGKNTLALIVKAKLVLTMWLWILMQLGNVKKMRNSILKISNIENSKWCSKKYKVEEKRET